MFRRRSSLLKEDRRRGLAFHWRLPVSSTVSYLLAAVLVGLMSAAIGAFVKVRIGDPPDWDEDRGGLVLVPADGVGARLVREAREAGPFPLRWDPGRDPAVTARVDQAVELAAEGGVAYRPRLRDVAGVEVVRADEEAGAVAVLPPLPEVEPVVPAGGEAETTLEARVVRSGGGATVLVASLPLAAERAVAAAGRRFLLEHDPEGRVLEVLPLSPEETPADLTGWLERARVEQTGGRGGWLVVESTIRDD